ncbi:MAG: flavin-containing monooxygenase [Moraxellaceae bacterium]
MPSLKATATPQVHDVIVIGAGFSGIGMAIKLDEAGFRDFLVLEQGDGIGGAWHFNTYPGVAVDIPSLSYSFSFERNPNWSRVFAPGAELKAYAEYCVDKYFLRSRIRLNTCITRADFDEASSLWCLQTETGEVLTARYVVGATGVLTQPKNPDIPGIESFKGQRMHTARWDHDIDLRDKRVAMIGTGASALQVIPEIAPDVKKLTVFQRTPIWVLPKPDSAISPLVQKVLATSKALQWSARMVSQAVVEVGFVITAQYHRYLPVAKVYERVALDHLKEQVPDPVLREKLTPRYGFGCKRPSTSNTYLQAFNRENVELETTAIEAITEAGVRTRDGRVHAVDILICATGFKVFESGNMPPFPIAGVAGLDLEAWWDEHRYQAYEGVSVPGFPNYFLILGPNGYNGASYFQLIEMQSRHILRLLKEARRKSLPRIEVKAEANARYFRAMKARTGNQVFFNNGCGSANSYYFDKHGDVPFRPATSVEAHLRSVTFPLSDYRFYSA